MDACFKRHSYGSFEASKDAPAAVKEASSCWGWKCFRAQKGATATARVPSQLETETTTSMTRTVGSEWGLF